MIGEREFRPVTSACWDPAVRLDARIATEWTYIMCVTARAVCLSAAGGAWARVRAPVQQCRPEISLTLAAAEVPVPGAAAGTDLACRS